MPEKTLYTAFKGKNNTSYQLASQFESDVLCLTNSFQGLERDICAVEDRFDAVIMFGVDKNLSSEVRIETCAEYNCEKLFTGFNIADLVGRFEINGVVYSVSHNPTRYLCNAAYYYMLKKNRNTIFIHIPSVKGMDELLMSKLVNMF